MPRFLYREHRAKGADRPAPGGLWPEGARGRRPHNGTEIGLCQARSEPVDADIKTRARAPWHGIGEEGEGLLPRLLLGFGSNRILKIENEAIGAARKPFREFFFPVGWKQKHGRQTH